jgi:hypothetical protein
MDSIEYNLEFLEAMLSQLDQYLLSKETFWPLGETPVSVGPPFPRMSLGQMMLSLDELRVQANLMSPKQIQSYQDLSRAFDEAREQRPANLEKKAAAELRQRANLWAAYVNDLRQAERAAESYSQDVKHRVLTSRLTSFIKEEPALQEALAKVEAADAGLRTIFQAGGFIWHPRLKPLYDRSDYWFLYGRPVAQG